MTTTERFARWWTRTYTAGLPGHLTGERRAEMASDLAEHAQARRDDGWSTGRIGAERLSRLGRGVPSDLAWRAEVLAGVGRSTTAVRQTVIAATSAASLLLAAYCAAFALYVSGGVGLAERPLLHGLANYADEVAQGTSSTVAAVVLGGVAVLLVGAALARPVSPLVANAVTLPAAMLAVLWFWLGISPLGVVIVAGAVADLVLRAPAVPSRA